MRQRQGKPSTVVRPRPTTTPSLMPSAQGSEASGERLDFNSGDEPTVRRLIFEPQPGKDGLEMTPTTRSALAKGVINESTDIQVHRFIWRASPSGSLTS